MATRQIKNETQLAKAVAWLGRLLSLIANEEARCRRAIERHQAKIDQLKVTSSMKVSGWRAICEMVAARIFNYVDPQRSELLTPGSQSFRVATGSIGYSEGRSGATQFLAEEADVVRAIEERLPKDRSDAIIKVKKTVGKNELKAAIAEDPGLADELADFVYVPIVDKLVIDPDNSEEALRTPISWFCTQLQAETAV